MIYYVCKLAAHASSSTDHHTAYTTPKGENLDDSVTAAFLYSNTPSIALRHILTTPLQTIFMLEYIKLILWKVSFDRTLFEKELKKGITQLDMDDMLLLQDWCLEIFSDRYYNILDSTFCGEASQSASH
jgi:hypothetical protein